MKSEFLTEIKKRGFIYQCSDLETLDEYFSTKKINAYIGFDCTGPSLHIGSLIQIMLIKWLQKFDHKSIILIGDYTTKIGDPSGKTKVRTPLSADTILQYSSEIKNNLNQYLNNVQIVHNSEWLHNMQYFDFLNNYARYFTINRMIGFEFVKSRLEKQLPLSFLEFNYSIIQSIDFLTLNKKFDINLQLGGSDQWGNIVNGIELIKRKNNALTFGLTTPLLLDKSGNKMGKTADGKAVWLNSKYYNINDFWQFWRNVDDKDVGRFLRLFTMLPLSQIIELEQLTDKEINIAKKILATEITSFIHGTEAAQQAEDNAEQIFEQDNISAIQQISIKNHHYNQDNIDITALLTDNKICASKGEVKRLIKGKGIKINDQIINENLLNLEKILPTASQKLNKIEPQIARIDTLKLSIGKKKHFLLKLDNIKE